MTAPEGMTVEERLDRLEAAVVRLRDHVDRTFADLLAEMNTKPPTIYIQTLRPGDPREDKASTLMNVVREFYIAPLWEEVKRLRASD